MTTKTRVTEPLREEHRDLWPHLQEVAALAADLDEWTGESAGRLREVVAFLRSHLVPHAQAEEAVLYPEYERVQGSPGSTDTMAADHVEIVRRIEELEVLAAEGAAARPGAGRLETLRARLYGLDAILALHFAKEEEVLLPALDEKLSEDEAAELFRAMGHVAHGGGHGEAR